jgi:hypothetical protein
MKMEAVCSSETLVSTGSDDHNWEETRRISIDADTIKVEQSNVK